MNDVNDFETLYDKTYQILFRYVVVKCDDLSNVEDIIQDVYFKVFSLIPRKGVDYFSIPILIKMCKNELFKYYSLKNKFNFIFYDDKVEYDIENFKSSDNIEKDYIIKDTINNVWNIIKKQKIDVQKIAALYFLNDMSIKDISFILNINENTVKSKLYRLINKLRKDNNYEK